MPYRLKPYDSTKINVIEFRSFYYGLTDVCTIKFCFI